MNQTDASGSDEYSWVFALSQALLCIIILCGNSMTILAVWKFTRLQTVTNKFVTSLALCDITVGLLLPYYMAFHVKPSLWKNIYACVAQFSLFVASNAASLTCLLMVSLDRYIAVVYPLHYHTYLSPRNTKIMLSTIGINGIALGIFTATAGLTSNKLKEGLSCDYATDVFDLVGIIGLCCSGLFFLFIVFLMYSRIFWVARKHRRTIQVQENHRGKTMNTKRENKTAVTLAIVVGLFFACWFPMNVVFMMMGLGIKTSFIKSLYQPCIIVAVTNSAMNPFIYGWRNKEFKQAYIKIIRCKTSETLQGTGESFTG